MIVAPTPKNEIDRMSLLRRLNILDTPKEHSFDSVTQTISRLLDIPICLVSLVDLDRQWFKSHHGLEVSETPRDQAFCAHAILNPTPLIVEDARLDERFRNNPMVTGEPYVTSYVGLPLSLDGELRLGTLCIIDYKPRKFTQDQIDLLSSFASQVETLLKLRLKNLELEEMANFRAKFLAEMSHEIRTPVTGITSIAHILRDKAMNAGDKDIEEYSEILLDCTNDLLSVVNDILDYSKLENRKIHLEKKSFNLIDLINQSARQFLPKMTSKGINLTIDIDSNVPLEVVSDPTRVKQVLVNLISNALKFTDRGAITIHSRKRENRGDFALIEFNIADSGIGIAKEKLEKLFAPYNQADSSISRVYGGTGLGLSICQGLCELLGGEIWCESTPRVGSTFSFTIKDFKKI